ncbi:conserved hypothetical protein [Ricinus communis]|uniref:Uncharacterized protein n=1 Tax=Ricinus communis TaxID=3988 RepID=B9TJR7_RICCO|nr:conserved hypothetical protein [Ricinus communis]
MADAQNLIPHTLYCYPILILPIHALSRVTKLEYPKSLKELQLQVKKGKEIYSEWASTCQVLHLIDTRRRFRVCDPRSN